MNLRWPGGCLSPSRALRGSVAPVLTPPLLTPAPGPCSLFAGEKEESEETSQPSDHGVHHSPTFTHHRRLFLSWSCRPLPHPRCCPFYFLNPTGIYISSINCFNFLHFKRRASLVARLVKNLPAMREIQVRSQGGEDPLEKGTATHSSTLAWRMPWTEGPGGLQSIESQRVLREPTCCLSPHSLPGLPRVPVVSWARQALGPHHQEPWLVSGPSCLCSGEA